MFFDQPGHSTHGFRWEKKGPGAFLLTRIIRQGQLHHSQRVILRPPGGELRVCGHGVDDVPARGQQRRRHRAGAPRSGLVFLHRDKEVVVAT